MAFHQLSETNKKQNNKTPQRNKQKGPIIQLHGNGQYFKFYPGVNLCLC